MIWHLKEDKLPPKLPVVFSSAINDRIKAIEFQNWGKNEELTQWRDYLNGIIHYISNRAIAWDYACNFQHTPNGVTYVTQFGYNVAFTIDESGNQAYVYVFQIDLNAEEFGLEDTSQVEESRKHSKTIYRINESQLYLIIEDIIGKIVRTA